MFYSSYFPFPYGEQKLLLFQTRGMDRTKEIRYLKKIVLVVTLKFLTDYGEFFFIANKNLQVVKIN
jgi:hypothetical protein